MRTRKIFRDGALNAALAQRGFAIRPLLSEQEVDACLAIYRDSHPDTASTKYNTLEIADSSHRTAVAGKLREIFAPRIQSVVEGYKFIGINFAVKKAGSDEEFPMHIDDDHCDRTRFVGLNVWIPLVDVHKGNGGLYVVPGSHLLPATINGIGAPFPYEAHRDLLLENAYFVEMKAGEALFFDDRLIHGSLTNPTGKDRIATISGMIPEEAGFLMYVNHDGLGQGELELFEVDENILLTLQIGRRPEGYRSLGVFKQRIPAIDEAGILDALGLTTA